MTEENPDKLRKEIKQLKYENKSMFDKSNEVILENKKLQEELEIYQELSGSENKILKEHVVTLVKRNTERLDEIQNLKSQLEEYKVKTSRYDMLKDRYINQNKKHFDELCGLYFDDDEVDKEN